MHTGSWGVVLKQMGTMLVVAGLALTFFAFFVYDTAPEGTHNLGLLQTQMMMFQAGTLAALAGAVLSALGSVLERLERGDVVPAEIPSERDEITSQI